MKIKMMTLAALFCCAMSSTMFTACGSDDDDDKVQVDDKKPVAAVVEYKFDVSDDMLAMLDMTVEYYDENCELKTEKLTQNEWVKKFRVTKYPVTSYGTRLKAKIKDGVDANAIENKSSAYGYVCDIYSVNAAGEQVTGSNGGGARFLFDNEALSSLSQKENGIMMSFPEEF